MKELDIQMAKWRAAVLTTREAIATHALISKRAIIDFRKADKLFPERRNKILEDMLHDLRQPAALVLSGIRDAILYSVSAVEAAAIEVFHDNYPLTRGELQEESLGRRIDLLVAAISGCSVDDCGYGHEAANFVEQSNDIYQFAGFVIGLPDILNAVRIYDSLAWNVLFWDWHLDPERVAPLVNKLHETGCSRWEFFPFIHAAGIVSGSSGDPLDKLAGSWERVVGPVHKRHYEN